MFGMGIIILAAFAVAAVAVIAYGLWAKATHKPGDTDRTEMEWQRAIK